MESQFISPRAVAEEERNYVRRRFDRYMQEEDAGRMTRALAIAALRDELDYSLPLDLGQTE